MYDRTEGNNGPGGAPAARAKPCLESMVKVDMSAATHVGKVRKNNEDHYLVARLGRSLEPLMTNLPSDAIPARVEEYGYGMIVADGMGGAAAGEVASRLAISLLVSLVIDTAKWGRRIDEQEVKALGERMLGYYSVIHSTLTQHSEAEPELSGMGTTLTVAYSFCSDLFVAHVGDSRAYLLRSGTLHRLTRDDTVAQALADRGEIPPEAVARHRYRHVLTNVLGGRSGHVETTFRHFRLEDGDCLLLCSDGLSDMVNDEAISDVLRRNLASEEACRSLLDTALQAGGHDNITAIVARYAFPPQAQNSDV